MKVSSNILSDMALEVLHYGTDEGLSNIIPDLAAVEKAELALHIMRSVAEGKKRIVIDIVTSKE